MSGAAAQAVLEAAARRAALRCADEQATTQDRIDCGELMAAAGFDEAARLLREAVAICSGFPAARAGGEPGFSIDLALAELRGLFDLPLPPLPDAAEVPPPALVGEAVPTAELIDACSRLFAALRTPAPPAGLAALLDTLRHELAERPPLAIADQVGAPMLELAARLALDCVRACLIRHHALAFPPYGSPALLNAAARLGEGGLGPYLGHVGQLLRHGCDLLALIQAAAEEPASSEEGRARIERWAVLLSPSLDRAMLLQLIEELGDLGWTRPLAGLLGVALRRPTVDLVVLWHLRDAGLDVGDLGLAAAAQRAVAVVRGRERLEWLILGEILGTAGDIDAAEEAFATAAALDPGDPAPGERMAALRGGDFSRFEIRGGFGTPILHRRRRAARRRADA